MLGELTQEFIQWIETQPPLGIYAVFFLVAYIENIVPPIPGDLLVAFGGYLAAEQVISIVPVLLLTTVASVIGFMTMYWLGSHWGTQIQQQRERFWLMKFISFKYIHKVRSWMQRWGQGVVLANRFLAGTRSVISITAGISHTPVAATAISSTVSSILWNAILLGFGWVVHQNWRIIGDYLNIYSQIILAIIAAIVLIRVGIYYFRNKKDAENDIRR